MVDALEQGNPVLVHCSDGWDRTSQLAAMAQLLLDPYYRTFNGFAALIEKDFCNFGHMFSKRSDPQSSEFSPILLQFLDAVWQVQRQFPAAFEFSSTFLLAVAEGYQSRWTSTFYGNCESDRKDAVGPGLWELIDIDASRNTTYEAGPMDSPPLRPKISMQAIWLWAELHLRYSPLV